MLHWRTAGDVLHHSWHVPFRDGGANSSSCCFIFRNKRCRCFQPSSSCWRTAQSNNSDEASPVTTSSLNCLWDADTWLKYILLMSFQGADTSDEHCCHYDVSCPLPKEAACFKFITNPLSRCVSTAQLPESAKGAHTRPPALKLSK